MKKRLTVKSLAVLLAIACLFQFLQIGFISAISPIDVVTEAPEPLIRAEVLALREESVKHFLNEDGSYTAAIYAEPVHFRDSAGEWQEIDNTLTLHNNKRSAANEATYSPAASGIDISVTRRAKERPFWPLFCMLFALASLPGPLLLPALVFCAKSSLVFFAR